MRIGDARIAVVPLAVIAIGFLTAVVCQRFVGAWAFVPLALVYWCAIALFVRIDARGIRSAWESGDKGAKINVLAYLPCLLCVVAFVWGLRSISASPLLIALSVVFVLVNPVAEEVFWRRYLLDRLPWRPWLGVAFSTALFTLSHPLMWGVFSVTIRSSIMILPLLVMGVVWSVVYLRTGALRHCIIAHAVVDALNLSVWVFLNRYVPPVV